MENEVGKRFSVESWTIPCLIEQSGAWALTFLCVLLLTFQNPKAFVWTFTLTLSQVNKHTVLTLDMLMQRHALPLQQLCWDNDLFSLQTSGSSPHPFCQPCSKCCPSCPHIKLLYQDNVLSYPQYPYVPNSPRLSGAYTVSLLTRAITKSSGRTGNADWLVKQKCSVTCMGDVNFPPLCQVPQSIDAGW